MHKTSDRTGQSNRLENITNKLEQLWTMVGNTPLIGIRYRYKDQEPGIENIVYAKCEHYNLTGSIKDRMALYILQRAYAENIK